MIAGKEEQPNRKMISAQPGEERNMVGGGAVDGGIPGEQDDNEVEWRFRATNGAESWRNGRA